MPRQRNIHTPEGQKTAYGHLQHARQIASSGIADQSIKKAILELSYGVSKLNTRVRQRFEVANCLIAENMFAIVRLEIAQATDQIINGALAVKREVTGSGKAEFAITVTGTLAMLAGNVLSGGGMTVLGNLIVSAGETAKALAKNDAVGAVVGVGGMYGQAVGLAINQGPSTDPIGANENTVSKGQWVGDSIGHGYAAEREILEAALPPRDNNDEPGGYRVVKKKTAFVPHGAGGTNAITYDVQKVMAESYGKALDKLSQQLAALGNTKNLEGAGDLLSKIMKTPGNKDATLHPMTEYVLKDGLEILKNYSGGEYGKLSGGSGWRGNSKTLATAKRWVSIGYTQMSAYMNKGKGIPSIRTIVDQVKATNRMS